MSIAENVEKVVATFQQGRTLSEKELGLDELIAELNKLEPRYRSVAFEGASMGVALANSLETWKVYAEKAKNHATQVHIGLGWAIAQPPKSHEGGLQLRETLSQIEPELQVKVLDGFGYWNGLFQRRATIRMQQIPENITPEFQAGFDQGVGRTIWYITKGDVAKVLNIINHFTEDRQADLWQGIGVASTYVGGCSDGLIAEFKSVSGEFELNFEKGIEAAEGSMLKAQS
jgi:hypothetical protein